MDKIIVLIKRNWLTLLGVVVGIIGGFLYWRFVGCSSGSCPITSSPTMSALWGAMMSGLVFSSFKKEKNEKISK